MTLRQLSKFSPLGCFGMLILGGVFSAQFGMSSVYAAQAGLSIGQISTFVATFFVGAVLLQYPIGWISDRMDRRTLIIYVAMVGTVGSLIGVAFWSSIRIFINISFYNRGYVASIIFLAVSAYK